MLLNSFEFHFLYKQFEAQTYLFVLLIPATISFFVALFPALILYIEHTHLWSRSPFILSLSLFTWKYLLAPDLLLALPGLFMPMYNDNKVNSRALCFRFDFSQLHPLLRLPHTQPYPERSSLPPFPWRVLFLLLHWPAPPIAAAAAAAAGLVK